MYSVNRSIFLALILITSLFTHSANAAKAILPIAKEVPLGDSLPIDGIWIIKQIDKRVMIEGDRMVVLDPWVHALFWEIEPAMVVSKEIKQADTDGFTGYDMVLLGDFDANLQNNGDLEFKIKGVLGSVELTFKPIELNDPDWFEDTLAEIPSVGTYPIPPIVGRGPKPIKKP